MLARPSEEGAGADWLRQKLPRKAGRDMGSPTPRADDFSVSLTFTGQSWVTCSPTGGSG